MKSALLNVYTWLLAAASFGLLAGCAATSDNGRNGHLVIVGGGLAAENNLIYDRILELGGEDATIGVIPTASGEPESSGPSYAGDFTDRGRIADIIDITFRHPEEAVNPAKAEQIRAHRILFFTGGVQERIVQAFRPMSGDTAGYEACLDVLERGGVICGSSAGAAMMSDPMIYWGNSEEALLIGHSDSEDRGVKFGKGMGFFPYGIVGQHFLQRGRLGRMIVALEETGVPRGYGVDANHAIDVDLAGGTISALGAKGLLLTDISGMQREGLTRRNIRISLLGGGDLVHGETGEIAPAPGKRLRSPNVSGKRELKSDKDPWDDYILRDEIVRLGASPSPELVLKAKHFDLVFTKDTETRLFQREGLTFEDDPTVVALRLDIIARDDAPAAAAELLQETSQSRSEGK